ncbi:hypothetical protein CEUSTIGMA_g2202.t1 [Chlamydomonas eustigma]|uniref:Uncharacterized protein n=1 Tax=Chlamydomonas eustigma TaxID=1157962 RepID=A0A250WVC6_9CHLO|nr:hypothetical protein CEUSTIGMA_g2202.t1 [Chlamydomonas eustigma]|eukprot:GAX74755.1 hypothetical protein CEUSTIGMA_g2202.t1 [Chlamydomonas eustigma]
MGTLERIARRRHAGITQSELAKEMGVAPRNFFYVVKCLEERCLVVRTPVMYRADANSPNMTMSNLLHLSKFAPAIRLGPNQYFKMIEADGRMLLDPNLAAYSIQDESRKLQAICSKIAAAPQKVVVEAELKLVLGYRLKAGHREWRKHKEHLVQRGCIEAFMARVTGKAVVCIKFLKEYKPEQRGGSLSKGRGGIKKEEAENDEECSEDDEAEDAGNGSGANLLVEVTLERQILEVIINAGAEGIQNNMVFKIMRLNQKRNAPSLNAVIKKYGIKVEVITVGKAVVNRLSAPEAMRDAYLQRHFVSEPPSGFHTSVTQKETGQATLNPEVLPEPDKPWQQQPRIVFEQLTCSGAVLPYSEPGQAATELPEVEVSSLTASKSRANRSKLQQRKRTLVPPPENEIASHSAEQTISGLAVASPHVSAPSPPEPTPSTASLANRPLKSPAAKKRALPSATALTISAAQSFPSGIMSTISSADERLLNNSKTQQYLSVSTPVPLQHAVVQLDATVAAATAAPISTAQVLPADTAVAHSCPAPTAPTAPPDDSAALQGTRAAGQRPSRRLTATADLRMQIILDRLKSHKFVIRQEIRSLVRAFEMPQEGPGSLELPGSRSGPDKKSIQRMTDVLEAAGKLKRLALKMPASRRSFGESMKKAEVLILPNVVPDGELIQQITEYIAKFEYTCRHNSSKRLVAERAEAVTKKAVPNLDDIPSLLPSNLDRQYPNNRIRVRGDGGLMAKLMAEEQAAKERGPQLPQDWFLMTSSMLRRNPPPGTHTDRQLTAQSMMDDLDDLLNGGPTALPAIDEALQVSGGGPAAATGASRLSGGHMVPAGTEALRRLSRNGLVSSKIVRARLLHQAVCQVVGLNGLNTAPEGGLKASSNTVGKGQEADREIYSFGLNQLIGSLPLWLVMQVLGSTLVLSPKLSQLSQSNTLTLSELSLEEREGLLDAQYRSRLWVVLSIMSRLGLVEAQIEASNWSREDTLSSSTGNQELKFWAKPEIIIEEPVGIDVAALEESEEEVVASEHHLAKRPRQKSGDDANVQLDTEENTENVNEMGKQVSYVPPAVDPSSHNIHRPATAVQKVLEGGANAVIGSHRLMDSEPRPASNTNLAVLMAACEARAARGEGRGTVLITFDLRSKTGELVRYWDRLTYLFTSRNIMDRDRLRSCFPGKDVPELLSARSWSVTGARLLSGPQWSSLMQRMESAVKLDNAACKSIAEDLGLTVVQVMRHAEWYRRMMGMSNIPTTPRPRAMRTAGLNTRLFAAGLNTSVNGLDVLGAKRASKGGVRSSSASYLSGLSGGSGGKTPSDPRRKAGLHSSSARASSVLPAGKGSSDVHAVHPVSAGSTPRMEIKDKRVRQQDLLKLLRSGMSKSEAEAVLRSRSEVNADKAHEKSNFLTNVGGDDDEDEQEGNRRAMSETPQTDTELPDLDLDLPPGFLTQSSAHERLVAFPSDGSAPDTAAAAKRRSLGPRIFWTIEEDRILLRALAAYRIQHGPRVYARKPNPPKAGIQEHSEPCVPEDKKKPVHGVEDWLQELLESRVLSYPEKPCLTRVQMMAARHAELYEPFVQAMLVARQRWRVATGAPAGLGELRKGYWGKMRARKKKQEGDLMGGLMGNPSFNFSIQEEEMEEEGDETELGIAAEGSGAKQQQQDQAAGKKLLKSSYLNTVGAPESMLFSSPAATPALPASSLAAADIVADIVADIPDESIVTLNQPMSSQVLRVVEAADAKSLDSLTDAVMIIAEALIQAMPRRKYSAVKRPPRVRNKPTEHNLEASGAPSGPCSNPNNSTSAASGRFPLGVERMRALPLQAGSLLEHLGGRSTSNVQNHGLLAAMAAQADAAAYIARPSRRKAPSGTLASYLGITGRHRGSSAAASASLGVQEALPASEDETPPLPVAAAINLIQSLMVHGETAEGPPLAESAKALAARFREEEILQAFKILRTEGWVNPVNGPNPFAMSAATRNRLLKAAGEPYTVELRPGAAAAARHILLKLKELPRALKEDGTESLQPVVNPSPDAAARQLPSHPASLEDLVHIDLHQNRVLIDTGSEVPGELVASLVGSIVRDELQVKPLVTIKSEVTPSLSGADYTDFVGPLQVDVVLLLSSTGGSTEERGKAGGVTSGVEICEAVKQVYSACDVASQTDIRERAEKACLNSLTSCSATDPTNCRGGSNTSVTAVECARQSLALIRAAGGEGVSVKAVMSQRSEPSNEMAAHGMSSSSKVAERVVSALLEYGLIRKLPGYKEEYLVASEHSQRLVHACTHGGEGSHEHTSFVEEEVMLLPWIDHKGCLNNAMWDSLERRVTSFVEHLPGVTEEQLYHHVGNMITMGSFRKFLEALVLKGSLQIKRVAHDRGTMQQGRLAGRPSMLRGGVRKAESAVSVEKSKLLDQYFYPSTVNGCA